MKCKLSDTARPGVRVVVKNPRGEIATLPANSSIALVRIHRYDLKLFLTWALEPFNREKSEGGNSNTTSLLFTNYS